MIHSINDFTNKYNHAISNIHDVIERDPVQKAMDDVIKTLDALADVAAKEQFRRDIERARLTIVRCEAALDALDNEQKDEQ